MEDEVTAHRIWRGTAQRHTSPDAVSKNLE